MNSAGATIDPATLNLVTASWHCTIVDHLTAEQTAREVRAPRRLSLHAAVQTLYHFFWDDFCDWYIELSKAS